MAQYSKKQLEEFTQTYLVSLGLPVIDAAVLTDVLLEADLRGKRTHGLLRLSHYVRRLKNGTIKKQPKMNFHKAALAAGVLDADDGLGHIAGVEAMNKACDIAEESGIGSVSVINSSHFGIAGYYPEIAAGRGLIGIACTHTDANTAPTGAAQSYFGSNSIAFSIPSDEPFKITVDFSTSKFSYGKIYEAKLLSQPLPTGCAFDDDGQYTTDPEAVNCLTTAAEHKGYGMALMIETFCSLLMGIPFCNHITDMYKDLNRPRKLGQFFLAVDIKKFSSLSNFRSSVSQMVSEIHQLKRAPGSSGIYVHGEQSHARKLKALREGIFIPENLLQELNELGNEFGLSVK